MAVFNWPGHFLDLGLSTLIFQVLKAVVTVLSEFLQAPMAVVLDLDGFLVTGPTRGGDTTNRF